jgi:hypothetical protein
MNGYKKWLWQYNMLKTSCLLQVSVSSKSHQITVAPNKHVTDCCQSMPCRLTSRSRNGSVFVITIHKPFRLIHNSFTSSLPVIKYVFMGMSMQQITGLHTRFTAHNGDQRSALLHEPPDIHVWIRNVFHRNNKCFYNNRNTFDKNILKNGIITMFCLIRQCSCSLCCVQKSIYKKHNTSASTLNLIFLNKSILKGWDVMTLPWSKKSHKLCLQNKICVTSIDASSNKQFCELTISCHKGIILKGQNATTIKLQLVQKHKKYIYMSYIILKFLEINLCFLL